MITHLSIYGWAPYSSPSVHVREWGAKILNLAAGVDIRIFWKRRSTVTHAWTTVWDDGLCEADRSQFKRSSVLQWSMDGNVTLFHSQDSSSKNAQICVIKYTSNTTVQIYDSPINVSSRERSNGWGEQIFLINSTLILQVFLIYLSLRNTLCHVRETSYLTSHYS